MAKKKADTSADVDTIIEDTITEDTTNEVVTETEVIPETAEEVVTKTVSTNTKASKKTKYNIGDIVYVAKSAQADLNGFKLFPQYKKYAYTVESVDSKEKIYGLRRLNLLLSLKEDDIILPSDKHGSSLTARKY